MNHIDLFSGIGGFALAAREVWGDEYHNILFCEIDRFCQGILKKNFGKVVIVDDIRKLIADGKCMGWKERSWEGIQSKEQIAEGQDIGNINTKGVDLLTGGFPCQPFSSAGKRRGTVDNRYLWPEMLECIRLFRPRWVIAENVPGILSIQGGLVFEQVCADLEKEGYAVQAFIIPACAKNAPHRRDRVWIIAYNNGNSEGQAGNSEIFDKEQIATLQKTGQGRDSKEFFGSGCNELSDSDASDTTSRRGEEVCEELQSRQSDGFKFDSVSWNKDWIEVATRFCVLDARVSDWVDRCFGEVVEEKEYDAIKNYRSENLRILREEIQKEEIWKELGGLHAMEEKEILLSFLCRVEKESDRQDDISSASEKGNHSEGMRSLWKHSQSRFASQRWKYKEQRTIQLERIMPYLPHEVALEIAEIWDNLWCAWSTMQNREVNIDRFKLSKAGHRENRLKALGNAIVPQVVMEIFRAIKYCDGKGME